MGVQVQTRIIPKSLAEFKAAMDRFAEAMGYNLRDVALVQGALLAQDSAVFTPPFPKSGGNGLSNAAHKAGMKAVDRDVRKTVVGADDKKGGAVALTAMKLVGSVRYDDFGSFQKLRQTAGLKSMKGNNSVFQKLLNDANAERAFKKAKNFFNKSKTRTNAFGRIEVTASDVRGVHQPIKEKYRNRIWKNKGPGFPWWEKYVVENSDAVTSYVEKQQEHVGLLKSGWYYVARKMPKIKTSTGKEKVYGVSKFKGWVTRHPDYGSVVFSDNKRDVRLVIANLIGDSDGVATGVDTGSVPDIAIGNRVKQMEAQLQARLEKAAKTFEK